MHSDSNLDSVGEDLPRDPVCVVTPTRCQRARRRARSNELRVLGHAVTVLAPSGRTVDLIAGHRALARGEHADVIAIGAAVPISRRSSLGVPVGVRANLNLALQQGQFDVVHGFEPGLPSISYLALRDSEALGVASFFSPERLGYPPRRSLRVKLLALFYALIATSETTAEPAARIASPATTGSSRSASTPCSSKPGDEAEAGRDRGPHSGSLPVARAALRSLRDLPGWEAVLLRTKPLSTRPGDSVGAARPRPCPVRPQARRGAQACSQRRRSSFRPRRARRRLRLEAFGLRAPRWPSRQGCSSSPSSQPRRSRGSLTTSRCASGGRRRHARPPRRRALRPLPEKLDAIYNGLGGRRRTRRRKADPLADRPWILRRPAHAHALVARLLDRGGRTARPRRVGLVSARSRSPTTTSLEAPPRRSSWRVAVS